MEKMLSMNKGLQAICKEAAPYIDLIWGKNRGDSKSWLKRGRIYAAGE